MVCQRMLHSIRNGKHARRRTSLRLLVTKIIMWSQLDRERTRVSVGLHWSHRTVRHLGAAGSVAHYKPDHHVSRRTVGEAESES